MHAEGVVQGEAGGVFLVFRHRVLQIQHNGVAAVDVRIFNKARVEEHVAMAEEEFGVEKGRTLLMAALESPKGILNAYEICCASDRLFGVAISGGDFRKCMQTNSPASKSVPRRE